ncbi:hypothetical protein ACH4SP_19600 [Streptomyces sp. NPDC021093]|uniref:hypothetical protein n=1 Tax=Streptomyces sp. NPDC021093 TaxID=3365112 RepID=UPI0037BB0D16
MGRWDRVQAGAAARVAVGVCTVAALSSGCGSPSDGERHAHGPAAAEVTVVRGEETYPLTVRITKWEAQPPRSPETKSAVHFSYRTTMTGSLPEVVVKLAACAVDAQDMVLLCRSIGVYDGARSARAAEQSAQLTPGVFDLAGTARVVLLPDQQESTPDDDYRPPFAPEPGERVRLR